MKRFFYHIAKLRIRLQMRNTSAELAAAEQRIANDKLYMDRLYRYRSDLQSELFWIERNNMQIKRGAA